MSAVVVTGAVVAGVIINSQNSAQSAEQAKTQAAQAERAQDADRFTKALTALGDADPLVRTNGITQLEHLMHDRPHYQPTVVERLTELVRYRAPRSSAPCDRPFDPVYSTTPPADVQLAITVLGRRDPTADDEAVIDLGYTCLRYVKLSRADLVTQQNSPARTSPSPT